MDDKKFNKILGHYERFFGSSIQPKIYHETNTSDGLHIDIVCFEASQSFPYKVLGTIGSSDYKMPTYNKSLSPYNEYIMFLDAQFDINDKENKWVMDFLFYVAKFAFLNKTEISYCHTIEVFNDDYPKSKDNNMTSAYIMFPQACPDTDILRLKLGSFKETITFLQAMPITNAELEENFKKGHEYLSNRFYSDDPYNNSVSFLVKAYR